MSAKDTKKTAEQLNNNEKDSAGKRTFNSAVFKSSVTVDTIESDEKENDFSYKRFLRHFIVSLSVFCAISFGVMIYYAATKVVVVSAAEAEAQADAQIELENSTLINEVTETVDDDYEVNLEVVPSEVDETGTILITCPPGIVGKDVQYSIRPDKGTVSFLFENVKPEFFVNAAPSGDFSEIKTITVNGNENFLELSFEQKDKLRPQIGYSALGITLSFAPYEKENVVIIDPYYGGIYSGTSVGNVTEKDINLKLAKRIEELSKDKNYTVYLTRTADITLKTEERLDIIECFNGSYYIGITLDSNPEDLKEFGMSAVYNKLFFRGDFENVEFADTVLKSAATAASNRALGLIEATETDVILMTLEQPAAVLKAGMISNSKEAGLLENDRYVDKIAQGVIDALDVIIK
ncbi:MAG: N-acetylmuramoyl-L-alanine amidase [Lachnospiraceae bacterium]|nr:N-acetylmuramoyl-L-alanine amidase [Lachnospiraceae bacterium]